MTDPAGPGVAAEIAGMAGPAALPRRNGELAFDAPWEGRVFGLALRTVDGLGVDWEEFRRRLIAAIAADPDRPYWASWAAALEDLVVAYGIATPAELAAAEEAGAGS